MVSGIYTKSVINLIGYGLVKLRSDKLDCENDWSLYIKNSCTNKLKNSIAENDRYIVIVNGFFTIGDLKKVNNNSICAEYLLKILDRFTDKKKLFHGLQGEHCTIVIDKINNNLIIVRDHFGLQDIYYATSEGIIAFSTNINDLLALPFVSRKINLIALNQLWFLEWSVPPTTIWNDVFHLPNAHYLIYNRESLNIIQYYKPSYHPRNEISELEATKKTREIVISTIENMLKNTDGDIGLLLSGGIDSNVVLASFKVIGQMPKYAFTFKGEGDTDESELARLSAKNFGISQIITIQNQQSFLEQIDSIVKIWAEPYSHGSVLSIYSLLPDIKANVSTLFTGDGGGEAFLNSLKDFDKKILSYSKYFYQLSKILLKYSSLFKEVIIPSSLFRKIIYILEMLTSKNEVEIWLKSRNVTAYETNYVLNQDSIKILNKKFVYDSLLHWENLVNGTADESFYAKVSAFTWGPNAVYPKTVKLANAINVNTRSPLTSFDFQNFIFSLPTNLKQNHKLILRNAFKDVLPDEIYNAPKKGLIPANRNVIKSNADNILQIIKNTENEFFNYFFNKISIERILNSHSKKNIYRTSLIYNILSFRSWAEQYNPQL